MSVIKQLLILHQQGQGIKSMARLLGISKNTVRSYLAKVFNGQYDIDELLNMDDHLMESRFHAGSPAYCDERYETIRYHLDHYIEELKAKGVTRRIIWEEYQAATPNAYSYSQFCFHLDQHLRARKPVMVLNHEPAAELMIDFAGMKTSYIDPQTGEVIACEIFVGVLPCSNYCYVLAVTSQQLEDLINAVCSCLHHLGGSPQAIVSDNLKSAITQASRYEPKINQAFKDMANHYGCSVVPARALKPRDKAAVEGMVKIVYSQVFARLRLRQFFSLYDLNKAIQQQTLLLNQRRLTDKNYTREEKFIASEKPLLKQLPVEKYEIKYYAKYTVAQNNHIRLSEDTHYYSVPYQYIGRKVQVIYTCRIVRIYFNHTLIATHFRDRRSGKYSTTPDHLCSQHQFYLNRSPQYYCKLASKCTPLMVQLFEKIFAQPGKYPEQLYRTCDGILQRFKKLRTPDEVTAFEMACQQAIDLGEYTYYFIDNYLKNNMHAVKDETPVNKPLPVHANIRGRESFY